MTEVPSGLTVPDPLQDFVTLIPHSGNECGGTKSLGVEVGDVDDRVSAMNVVKQGMLEPKTEFRSMPPSRNSPCAKLVSPDLLRNPHGEGIPSTGLTIAHNSLLSVRGSHGAGDLVSLSTRLPFAPPTHLTTLMVETAPPVEKSDTISKSPSIWCPLKPPLEFVDTVASCKNQNPAVASPLLSKRSMPK